MNVKKMVYMHNEFYSSIKKNDTVICRKMDGTGDHHIKQNKSDLERQTSHVFSHVRSRLFFKDMKVELFGKRKGTSRRRRGNKRG
jgi:hypothetical protein